MNDKERELLERLKAAIPKMSEEQKKYLLGYAEGVSEAYEKLMTV